MISQQIRQLLTEALKPEALEIVDLWLKTEFQGGRHIARIKKIDQ